MREKLPCGCVTVSPLHLRIIRFIPLGLDDEKSIMPYSALVTFFTEMGDNTEEEVCEALDDLITHKVLGDVDADNFFLTQKGIELYVAMGGEIKR
jgi:hypothetical protein